MSVEWVKGSISTYSLSFLFLCFFGLLFFLPRFSFMRGGSSGSSSEEDSDVASFLCQWEGKEMSVKGNEVSVGRAYNVPPLLLPLVVFADFCFKVILVLNVNVPVVEKR